MSQTPPMPDSEFDVIYADPPWSYNNGGVPNGGVDHHYETMDIEDIKALDVPAADDAILYLWATATHTPEAIDVLRSWGFEYKTQACWDKRSVGVGYWFRGQHELILVGVRGDVSPPGQEDRRSSVFQAKRGEHSSKPGKVRTHIEQAHPDADKLELFSRDGCVGWTMWGDESPDCKQDTLDSGWEG